MNFKSIQSLIDDDLLKEQAKEHVSSGKITPSSLGRCYRYQWWKIKKEPPSDDIGIKALRTFKAGKFFHEFVQNLIPDGQKEVKVELEDFTGRADIVTDDTVYDIKSKNGYQFKGLMSKPFEPKDNLTNVLQLMSYVLLLQKKYGVLCFISKEDLEIVEKKFHIDDWRSQVMEELDAIRTYISSPSLPPAIPRAYGGKECKYCNYRTLCEAQGDKPNVK